MRPRLLLRDRRAHHVLALLGYTLLIIVFTWPLLVRIDSHIIGAGPVPGDNYEYVWKMWWVPHALFERGISPFFHPDVAWPTGYPLAYGEITPAHTFLLLPLTVLFGATVAYNLAILLSAVLTGWFTYLLARRWLALHDAPGPLFLGAFFAGLALAFSSYRLQRMAGHLPLIDTHWLVLALFGLDRWLDQQRWRDAVVLALGVGLAALSSWYYGFMLALLLPVYGLAYMGKRGWTLLASRRTWAAAALTLAIVLGLVMPFLLPYLQVSSAGAAQIPLADVRFWSASPLDYLLPNPLHPLWGDTVQTIAWPFADTQMPYEFMLGIGWVTLVIGIVGWRQTTGNHWRALKWVMLVAFVLSLGPFLNIGRLPTPLPLPVRLLRDLLPFADGIRSWGRFSLFVMLGMSLLAGVGLMSLLRPYHARRQRLLFALVSLALLFGMWRTQSLNPVAPRPVDVWLAQQPENAPIMQFPVDDALSGPAMLYTRYHGKPVVYGYGTYFPFIFRQQYPMLATFPADAAIDQLATWGVRYVLVNTTSFDLSPLADQPRLRPVITLGDQAVYELVADESRANAPES